jgi:hypothetical protein
VATVIDGDFEWDDEKAQGISPSMAFHSRKQRRSSLILPPSFWMTAPVRIAWSSSGLLCAIESFTWFTSNVASETASSVRDRRLVQNEMSTKSENTDEPIS